MSSIVLFSARSHRTITFYRAAGIELEEEDHGHGMIHAATNVGDVHLAVLPAADGAVAPGWRADGSTFVGFYVDSLDETLAALSGLNARLIVDHQGRAWVPGCAGGP